MWFHGGGWASGSSYQQDIYDGVNLVELGDVVFVSINHRLNVLGYLDLSAYGEKYKDSANVGVLDMLMALEWVHDNAAAFGGDPNNVTIAGQSGGGSKVLTLMGMPAAQGLFHKAVVQSGGNDLTVRTHEEAQAEAAKLLEVLGMTAEELETIDYDDLKDACDEAHVTFGPVLDEDIYPSTSLALSKDIPMMCGNVQGEFSTNIGDMIFGTPNMPTQMVEFIFNAEFAPANWDEAKTMEKLTQKFGDKAEAVKAAFEAAYPGHPAGEALYTNDRTRMSSEAFVEAFYEVGGTAYQYIQAWTYPMFGGVVPIHTAGDVPLWFYNVDLIRPFISGYEDVAWDVSYNMATALLTFMRTGSPSTEDLPWESWNPEADPVMVFDEVCEVRYHHEDALIELLQSVPSGGGGKPGGPH